VTRVVALAVLAGCALAGCAQQGGTGTAASAPDDPKLLAQRAQLGGEWVRTDEVGSGDFGSMLARLTPAELQPAAQALLAERKAQQAERDKAQLKAEGGVYKVAAKCDKPGIVFMMQHSGAIDIVLQKDEILVVPEHPGAQTIYMDGRPHPSLEHFTPVGAGHSVGHWEGATLVVSTVGMRGEGSSVPGGGIYSAETELVERFELLGPDRLHVTFTWTDPKIYVKPHSYTLTYAKQPADSYAFESWCDVSDPLQGQSVVVPPQKS